MKDLKQELKTIITDTMLPASQAFIKELQEEKQDEDTLEAFNDMGSLVEELQFILTAIEEDKLSDEEALIVYEKIVAMLEEEEG